MAQMYLSVHNKLHISHESIEKDVPDNIKLFFLQIYSNWFYFFKFDIFLVGWVFLGLKTPRPLN